MDLTTGVIEKIEEMAKVEIQTIGGRQFSNRQLFAVDPPLIKASGVATLTAISQYLHKNPDALDLAKIIVHVAGHDKVQIFSVADDVHRTRETYLVAQVGHTPFRFGTYMGQEDFIIGMQTFFVQGENTDVCKILACAGNVADENVAAFGDDGVTQQVQVKASILRKSEVQVPNPVTLAPYRTFMEVAQPASKFVFRMKQGAQSPQMALFEADGGNWKLDSIDRIKTWLEAELPEGVVILA